MAYPYLTAMRLDIENPALLPAGNVLNQIKNTDGTLGGWGWVTPTGSTGAGTATDGFPILSYAVASGPASTYTEPVPVTPGTPYTAGWTTKIHATISTAYWYKGTLQYLDAAGTVVSSSTTTPYLSGGAVGSITIGGTVPAGAVQVRLLFNLYGTSAGANPTVPTVLGLRDVRMGPVSTLTKISPLPLYTNLITSSTSITVAREDLNVGTLTASIPDATYDPALNAHLRPGRRVRLVAYVGGTDSVIFTGKISVASVTYDPTRTDNKRAQISLTAVDAVADLANVSRPKGVALINELRDVMEGAGVPWQINGSTAQGPSAAVVTSNESASALDQIAITRDSRHGYAWVSRTGVLSAYDSSTIDATLAGTYTESDYGDDLDVAFDVDRCINLVTIKHLRINAATGETVEVPYGPFRSEASIADWGPHSAEFTVQGLTDTTAAMRTFADEIFAASAVPQIGVNGLTIAVRTTADLVASRALLDLYRKVRVTNTGSAIDQSPRVTSITHRITPKSWLMDLGFEVEGGVAAPQITPALVSQETITPAPTQQVGVVTSGTFVVGTSLAVPVTFPVAFDAAPQVFANVRGTAASNALTAVTVTAQTTTGCTLNLTRSTGTTAVVISWFAVVS